MLSAGLYLDMYTLPAGSTAGTPDSSPQLHRLLHSIYTVHLSTVHLGGSALELNPTHSTQGPRTQLVEEELSLTPSRSTETQLEDSS